MDNVTTCVATALSGACALGTTPRSNEAAFLREVGDGTVYKRWEHQGNRDSAIQNIIHNKQTKLAAIPAIFSPTSLYFNIREYVVLISRIGP